MLKDSVNERQTFRIWVTATAMLGFVLKTVYELTAAQTIFVGSAAAAMIPVPLAHIVGGLAGLVTALALPDSRQPVPGSHIARQIIKHFRTPSVHRLSQSGARPVDIARAKLAEFDRTAAKQTLDLLHGGHDRRQAGQSGVDCRV